MAALVNSRFNWFGQRQSAIGKSFTKIISPQGVRKLASAFPVRQLAAGGGVEFSKKVLDPLLSRPRLVWQQAASPKRWQANALPSGMFADTHFEW
jgi:hypothetical protein